MQVNILSAEKQVLKSYKVGQEIEYVTIRGEVRSGVIKTITKKAFITLQDKTKIDYADINDLPAHTYVTVTA